MLSTRPSVSIGHSTAPHDTAVYRQSHAAAPAGRGAAGDTYTMRDTEALAMRLGNLARALGPSFNTHLKPGSAWAYDRKTQTMTYPTRQMLGHSDAANLGAVCREVARQQYAAALPAGTALNPAQDLLWHTLESIRTGKVMGARYAGVPPMLRAAYATAVPDLPPAGAAQPRVVEFSQACLNRWLGNTAALERVRPEVRALVERLGPAIDSATRLPPNVDVRFDALSSQQVAEEVRHAYAIMQTQIWPEVARLWDKDQQQNDAAQPEKQRHDQQQQDKPQPSHNPSQRPQGGASQRGALQQAVARATQALGNVANASAEQAAKQGPGQAAGIGAHGPQAALPAQQPAPRPPDPRAKDASKPARADDRSPEAGAAHGHSYITQEVEAIRINLRERLAARNATGSLHQAHCQRYRQQIDAIEQALESAFQRRAQPKLIGPFRSGNYDIRRALQAQFRAQATGVAATDVFTRRDEPTKRSVAFIVCADISGSMEGERIKHLREGASVILEPARRLDIPLGVIAFNHRPYVLKRLDDELEDADCDRILNWLRASGENNECAALKEAAHLAERSQADQVFILFITDGAGDPRLPAAIARLQRDNPRCKVMGLGIGPGCEQVARLYPRSLRVDNVTELPAKLGDLFVAVQCGEVA